MELKQNPASPDVIGRTSDWFVAAGQMPIIPEPSTRQTAFYAGMQCEELAEKLEATLGLNVPAVEGLVHLADQLKDGRLDNLVQKAFDMGRAQDLLDADIDLIWVTVGGARAQGADVPLAYNLVADANWAKFPGGVATRDPVTGKITKPAGWTPPNLQPAVFPAYRGNTFSPEPGIDPRSGLPIITIDGEPAGETQDEGPAGEYTKDATGNVSVSIRNPGNEPADSEGGAL